MRLAHLLLPSASQYERKCQRIDRASFPDVVVVTPEQLAQSGADVAHVYATGELPGGLRIDIPYIASAPMKQARWSLRRPVAPRIVVSPLGGHAVPEAVEDRYFVSAAAPVARDVKTVGVFLRPTINRAVEQTRARIERTRPDVRWILLNRVPAPEDLQAVDVWVDPAVSDNDFDGFVAEAQAVGLPVVASRTAINVQRLEQGRTGWLVPPGDANELTHAILAALFKTEVAEGKQKAAKQTVSKFRARQRVRILGALYESLIR